MDIQSQFILNRFKNKNSIDKDFNLNTSLKNTTASLNDVDMNTIINLNTFFNKKRNLTLDYKIYGTINNSENFLYNKKINPSSISDFLKDETFIYNEENLENPNYDIYNQFNYYIVYPFNYKLIDSNNNYFQIQYKKITVNNDIKLLDCSYSTDIYNTKIYNYILNEDLSIKDKFTYLEKYEKQIPLTDLYLYIEPKNYSSIKERVFKNFNTYNKSFSGLTIGFNNITSITSTLLNIIKPSEFPIPEFTKFYEKKIITFFNLFNLEISQNNFQILKEFLINYLDTSDNRFFDKVDFSKENEILNGEVYFFNEDDYTFSLVQEQYYSIKNKIQDDIINSNLYKSFTTTIVNNKINTEFEFKYKPFYQLNIRKFSNYLETIYISGINNTIIPEYSIKNETYYIWRDLLDIGYIEQDEEDINGVDYPYINQKHYLYNNINIQMLPDLSDRNTINLFKDLLSNKTITKEINEFNIGNIIC